MTFSDLCNLYARTHCAVTDTYHPDGAGLRWAMVHLSERCGNRAGMASSRRLLVSARVRKGSVVKSGPLVGAIVTSIARKEG